MIIGIDVGISTTKIVGLSEGRVISPIRITAADQVTSLYGAFGKFLHDNHIELSDVEQVMVTGVGSAYIDKNIYGIPTNKVDEFVADGLGARFESGLDKAIVVSMGTGTSFVQCEGDEIRHIGGIGIGGGTLQGLARVMLNTRDPKQIETLAKQGKLMMANLSKDTNIAAGGIVCSSGVGGIYPKDLILGKVENTQESGKDVSYIAVVNPQLKINELTDVFVITDFEGKNQVK